MIMIIKDSIVIDRYHLAYVTSDGENRCKPAMTFLIIEELKVTLCSEPNIFFID